MVGQFAKVLPHDSKARRVFVTTGGLKKVQEIKADPASALHEHITTINSCYPEEIVRCDFTLIRHVRVLTSSAGQTRRQTAELHNIL